MAKKAAGKKSKPATAKAKKPAKPTRKVAAKAKKATQTKKAVGKAAKSTKKAAKKTVKKTTKTAVAKKPASKATKKPVKKTTKATATKAAKKPAKTPAKKSTKSTAVKPTKKAVKKATKTASKPSSKSPAKKVKAAKKESSSAKSQRRVLVKVRRPVSVSGSPKEGEPPIKRTVKAVERSNGAVSIKLHHRKPTRSEFTELRKLLLERRKRLMGDVKDLEAEAFSEETQNVSSNHLADSSFEQYEQEFNLSMIENETEELKQIGIALEKLETGDFGTCEACGIAISIERLKVKPFSRICIHCRTKFEEEGGGERYGVLPEMRI